VSQHDAGRVATRAVYSEMLSVAHQETSVISWRVVWRPRSFPLPRQTISPKGSHVWTWRFRVPGEDRAKRINRKSRSPAPAAAPVAPLTGRGRVVPQSQPNPVVHRTLRPPGLSALHHVQFVWQRVGKMQLLSLVVVSSSHDDRRKIISYVIASILSLSQALRLRLPTHFLSPSCRPWNTLRTFFLLRHSAVRIHSYMVDQPGK
jgi:hypothetical protein